MYCANIPLPQQNTKESVPGNPGKLLLQYRNLAAVKVNAEQLLFNWQPGRDLVIRKAEEKWGSGIVEQVSLDLQEAFPESKVTWVHSVLKSRKPYSKTGNSHNASSENTSCLSIRRHA